VITLYETLMSTCCQKVRYVLAEKNLSYKSRIINLQARENNSTEYLKINPKGVVPSLVDNNHVITESNIITQYLDEKYSAPSFMPDNPLGRAEVRLWMLLFDTDSHDNLAVITGVFTMSRHLKSRYPTREQRELVYTKVPDNKTRERHRDIVENGLDSERLKTALKAYLELIQKMNMAIEKFEWLASCGLSLADVTFFPNILRLEHLSLQELWRDYPAFQDWYSRMKNTKGYKEGIERKLDLNYLERMASYVQEDRCRVDEILATISR